jgi:hypothetical protein
MEARGKRKIVEKNIIHDIDTIGTSKVEFLHRSKKHWCATDKTKSYINGSGVH